MDFNYRLGIFVMVACAITAPAYALPPIPWDWKVTNWEGHNPAALTVTDANTNSPGFSNASGVALVSGFTDVTLNPGDSIHATGSMTVAGASGFFPIQFRIGLFNEVGSGPSTGDGAGYRGITIENDGLLKETVGINPNPFSSAGSHPISAGFNVGGGTLNEPNFTAQMSLDIFREVNTFHIDGHITTGEQYYEIFFADNYPPELGFSFNRVGFLVGGMLTVNSVNLNDVAVTLIPEPGTALLGMIGLTGVAMFGPRRMARPARAH